MNISRFSEGKQKILLEKLIHLVAHTEIFYNVELPSNILGILQLNRYET